MTVKSSGPLLDANFRRMRAGGSARHRKPAQTELIEFEIDLIRNAEV